MTFDWKQRFPTADTTLHLHQHRLFAGRHKHDSQNIRENDTKTHKKHIYRRFLPEPFYYDVLVCLFIISIYLRNVYKLREDRDKYVRKQYLRSILLIKKRILCTTFDSKKSYDKFNRIISPQLQLPTCKRTIIHCCSFNRFLLMTDVTLFAFSHFTIFFCHAFLILYTRLHHPVFIIIVPINFTIVIN